MFFRFFRKQQEAWINSQTELLREDIRELLDDCFYKAEKRDEEQFITLTRELKHELGQHLGEVSLQLERTVTSAIEYAITSRFREMADRETIERLKKELEQSRTEREQLNRYASELISAIGSLKGSVEELRVRVEELCNRGQMTSAPWIPYGYQPTFQPQPPFGEGTLESQNSPDVPNARMPWPVSGGGQPPQVKALTPWEPEPLETMNRNPGTLDVGNCPATSRAVSETSATAVDSADFGSALDPVSVPEQVLSPVFTVDSQENKYTLTRCASRCTKLKQNLEQACETGESFDSYRKLVEKCQRKLEDLSGKIDEKGYDPEKTANEMVKVLKQTVVKGLSQRSVCGLMGEFLVKCGLRKIEFRQGQKLTDGDYEYVDDLVFYEEVDKETMDNCIIEIRQDAYVLDYVDENGLGEAVIPGSYKIGKYKAV